MPPPAPATTTTRASLADLVRYFLYLGTFGFGGPVALIGFMHRIYPPALTPRIVRSSNAVTESAFVHSPMRPALNRESRWSR